jgi:hypothetical protein
MRETPVELVLTKSQTKFKKSSLTEVKSPKPIEPP